MFFVIQSSDAKYPLYFSQQLKRELPKLQKGSNRSSLRKDKSFGKFTPDSVTQISLISFLLLFSLLNYIIL